MVEINKYYYYYYVPLCLYSPGSTVYDFHLFINSKNVSSSRYVMFHQILLHRQNSQDISIYLLNYAEYYSVIQPEKLPSPPHPPTFNIVLVVSMLSQLVLFKAITNAHIQ